MMSGSDGLMPVTYFDGSLYYGGAGILFCLDVAQIYFKLLVWVGSVQEGKRHKVGFPKWWKLEKSETFT